MTFGFEREYFVKNGGGEFVVAQAHNLPFDGCGYLAEARGEYNPDPHRAAFLLLAEEDRLIRLAASKGLTLSTSTPQKLNAQLVRECFRQFGKQPQTDYSASGRWNKSSLHHAGLHVHFGCVEEVESIIGGNRQHTYRRRVQAQQLNLPRIIYLFDKRFKEEIKNAKRAPGLYKLQPHGFEYRSLPASTNVRDVVALIQEHRKDF
jgi:hypothetical protein